MLSTTIPQCGARLHAKYNHSTVWNETPCICLRKDSIRRHSLSLQHMEAVERELCRHYLESNLKGVVLGVAKITALLYFSGDNPVWTPTPIILPRSRCACGVIS